MGVVRDVIANVFTAAGDVGTLNSLVYNGGASFNVFENIGRFGVLLMSANLPAPDNDRYRVSLLNPNEAVTDLGLEGVIKRGERLDWNLILSKFPGRHIDHISTIYFKQPSGNEIQGTFSVNALDPTFLDVQLDLDTLATSSSSVSAVINPLTFNPRPNLNQLPLDGSQARYLLIDDIGGGVDKTFEATTKTTLIDTGVRYGTVFEEEFSTQHPYKSVVTAVPRFEVFVDGISVTATKVPSTDPDSNLKLLLSEATDIGSIVRYKVYVNFDGSDAWATYQSGQPATQQTKISELIAKANSIVEFDAELNGWKVVFDPETYNGALPYYITNLKTGVQYKWDGIQWLRSFEGEYRAGSWRMVLSQ